MYFLSKPGSAVLPQHQQHVPSLHLGRLMTIYTIDSVTHFFVIYSTIYAICCGSSAIIFSMFGESESAIFRRYT